jgi:predicted DNA-binding protein (MmcQ/YjbR family)
MVDCNVLRNLAIGFPKVEELPHFEKASFRINKKIFATLTEAKMQASIKLSEVDQSIFCAYDAKVIHPVPNKWGLQGWTIIHLQEVTLDLLEAALAAAYEEVSKKK